MTSTGINVPFSRQATSLQAALSGQTRALLQELQREMHYLVKATAIARSPVGGPADKHPGDLRRSWKDRPGNVESAIEQLQPTSVVAEATHGLVIDRGRRPSGAYAVRSGKTKVSVPTKRRRKDGSVIYRKRAGFFTVKSRMLGSKQAPLGVKGDVLRTLEAEQEAIFQRAAAAAERKAGR